MNMDITLDFTCFPRVNHSRVFSKLDIRHKYIKEKLSVAAFTPKDYARYSGNEG